jgi:hypothetical protein
VSGEHGVLMDEGDLVWMLDNQALYFQEGTHGVSFIMKAGFFYPPLQAV